MSGSPAGTKGEIPELFRGRSDRFPAIRSREFISTSREILPGDNGLQALVMEPLHTSPIYGEQ